jgi:hypothetical protein
MGSRGLEQEGVQVLLAELGPGLVETAAAIPVRLPRDCGGKHPERNLLAVDTRFELGLEGGDPLELPLRDVCEVVLACPAPQEPCALVACGSAYRPHLLELDEAGMAFVDRL